MSKTTPVDNGFADAEKSFAGHCPVAFVHFMMINTCKHSQDNITTFLKIVSSDIPEYAKTEVTDCSPEPFNSIPFIYFIIYQR